jgi:hypothetical protein
MFGLYPTHPVVISRGASEQVIGNAFGEVQVLTITSDPVDVEAERCNPG